MRGGISKGVIAVVYMHVYSAGMSEQIEFIGRHEGKSTEFFAAPSGCAAIRAGLPRPAPHSFARLFQRSFDSLESFRVQSLQHTSAD